MQDATTFFPTPAPEGILGTPQYYAWRARDFEERYGQRRELPSYYLTYGDKYVRRFHSATRRRLSAGGKQWLDEALLLLQVELEIELTRRPHIEFHERNFNEFTFRSHVHAYLRAGLFDLPLSDLRKILQTLDVQDALLHPLGFQQIRRVMTRYTEFKFHSLLNTFDVIS